MYRLCLTSVVVFALGTGASLAEDTSTPAADNIATIDSAAPNALDSPSAAGAASNPNAEPSPVVENDAQAARERSIRRHYTAAPTKTTRTAPSTTNEIATSTTDEIAETKTVEIKDLGERTVCEDVVMPGSRMVVGHRCRTYNIHDRSDMKAAEEKDEQKKQTLADLRRMQDNLEREQRQQEWNRQRAAAALVMGSH